MDSIHEASDPVDAVRKAEGIFIGEKAGILHALLFHLW